MVLFAEMGHNRRKPERSEHEFGFEIVEFENI